jgi:hypothetical protein
LSVDYRTPPRPESVNYDEAAVAPYALPDASLCADGTSVDSAATWETKRRGELLQLFRSEIYGRCPDHTGTEVIEHAREERSLGGLATRLELDVHVTLGLSVPVVSFQLLVFVPNTGGPHPTFLGLNFSGNHGIHPDPAIRLTRGWLPAFPELGLESHEATEAARGLHAKGWPVEFLLSRGYAVATLYAGDLAPDYPDGARQSPLRLAAGPRPDACGAISAWAFGLSRALDALETVDSLDARRVALLGHSRLGKAALWAAAQDTRFALVAANGSGRAGAALLRRRFGETVADLNRRFPHWFCDSFGRYSEREAALPVDQHELLALIAPRPLCLGDGSLDRWADPRGALLACLGASPFFELYGAPAFAVDPDAVPLSQLIGERLAYYRRPGAHDLTKADLWQYVAFADRWLRGREEPHRLALTERLAVVSSRRT